MTNGDRAERARMLLEAGLMALGDGHPYEVGDESMYTDIITDILHLAHSAGYEPSDILSSAVLHVHFESGRLDE